jgi:hypothetical protein
MYKNIKAYENSHISNSSFWGLGSLLIFLCLPALLSAQLRLEPQLNMFRADDSLTKEQVSYKDPGRKGENVLWDFSQLALQNEAYDLRYAASGESEIFGVEHLTQYRYCLRGDSLLLLGYSDPSTEINHKQPELLIKFPLVYGQTHKSYYYGHGHHGYRLEMDVMGSVETAADACGMMILPGGDTIKQVLRTHSLKTIAEDLKPISKDYQQKDTTWYYISPDSIEYRLANDSVIFVIETFRWYEKGYRYPVFETVGSWEQRPGNAIHQFLQTAFYYPPQEQYYLANDTPNTALRNATENSTEAVNPWEGLTYNIYPNPATTLLTAEIYLPRPAASVRMQIRTTAGFIYLDEDKGSRPQGVCSLQTNIAGLPVGNYVLSIRLDDYVISEVIMKRIKK